MLTLDCVSEVTRILGRVQHGHSNAAEELLPLVYDELRRLAAHTMANEVPGQTLQPTALVHEAWLRLSQQANARWQNREQFYAMAADFTARRCRCAYLGAFEPHSRDKQIGFRVVLVASEP